MGARRETVPGFDCGREGRSVKELELTMYPLLEKVGRNARPGYMVGKRAVSVAEAFRVGQAKRLTDAELAAEYWLLSSRRQRMLGYHDGPDSETRKQARIDEDRMKVVERFATLPHYDEKEMNA